MSVESGPTCDVSPLSEARAEGGVQQGPSAVPDGRRQHVCEAGDLRAIQPDRAGRYTNRHRIAAQLIGAFISVTYTVSAASPEQCKLCTCCSSCAKLCTTCKEEDEEPFEALLRVMGLSHSTEVRSAMLQMDRECEEEEKEEEGGQDDYDNLEEEESEVSEGDEDNEDSDTMIDNFNFGFSD